MAVTPGNPQIKRFRGSGGARSRFPVRPWDVLTHVLLLDCGKLGVFALEELFLARWSSRSGLSEPRRIPLPCAFENPLDDVVLVRVRDRRDDSIFSPQHAQISGSTCQILAIRRAQFFLRSRTNSESSSTVRTSVVGAPALCPFLSTQPNCRRMLVERAP